MRDKHSSKKIFFTIVALLVVLTGSTVAVIARTHPEAPHVAIVKSGANQFTQLSYQGEDGKNALVLLKKHAQVVTKNSSYGVYVESINGVVAGGPSGKYWMLYVNGRQAQVGAASYTTKAGDVITWKYE